MKGLDYQPKSGYPSDWDPLANSNFDWFKEDVKRFSDIGVNTIRVYEIDENNEHDLAMAELERAGIYLVLDLTDPVNTIDRANPIWNTKIFNNIKKKVDEFVNYPALLGFICGNEVAGVASETIALPYVKASIRDVKKYIKDKYSRQIPVGYAATDAPPIRWELQTFLDCGSDEERADFFGVNIYSWCSPSTFEIAFKEPTKNFTNWDVPVVFTEYGCNTPNRNRDFAEVAVIFGPQMTGVFSGGFVFEYSEEVNSFGLGKSFYDNKSFVPFQDYTKLKEQFASISPSGPTYDNFTYKGIKQDCPTKNGINWLVESTPLPRTPNEAACDCIASKLTCRTKQRDSTKISPELGKDIGSAFSFICGKNPSICDLVMNSPQTGEYGNFSACDPLITISIVMTQYYNSLSTPDACDFNGIAAVATPVNSAENCQDLPDIVTKSTKSTKTTNTQSGSDSSSSQVVSESEKENESTTKSSGSLLHYCVIVLFAMIYLN